MNGEPSSSSPPAACNGNLITLVNHNDVFLGRGTESNDFIGNQRFRSIVERHKKEYQSLHKHKAKQMVARKIIDQIHALGGRFLKDVKIGALVNGVKKDIWCEVEEKVAIEKCKQALRKPEKPLEGGVHGEPTCLPIPPSNFTFILPSMTVDVRWATVADARFFDSQHDMMVPQPQGTNPFSPFQFNMSPQSRNDVSIAPASWYHPALQDWPTTFIAPEHALLASENVSEGRGTVAEDQSKDIGCAVATARPPMSKEDASVPMSEDFSEFLLSFLEDTNCPRFTVEQMELERAMQTDEERAAALSDLFGKQCAVETHQSKKARRDLDHESIAFLVNQMRLEIERIPEKNKRALMEAQLKCHADEFSDARLERFLRCKGMNTKLGAQRFVDYWKSRQEVFGPDKFVLRMTLSEALCDDLAAVEACVVRPLPRLDSSGRQLLLAEPCRHTREGYTSESMLRAVWYVIEVMAEENTDMDSGFVLVHFLKDFTIWDYDHGLYDRIIYFNKNCWPLKIIANHLCCPTRITVKIINPIVYALMDKHMRSRILIYDIPESQVPDVLSSCGIREDMLPTEMGGTVQFDHAEWIANRRAAELKEI